MRRSALRLGLSRYRPDDIHRPDQAATPPMSSASPPGTDETARLLLDALRDEAVFALDAGSVHRFRLDSNGLPLLRMTFDWHENDYNLIRWVSPKMREILEKMGARNLVELVRLLQEPAPRD